MVDFSRRTFLKGFDPTDNTYLLFHRVFQIKIPYIDLIELDEIQVYGHVSGDDPEDDRRNANTKVTCYMTIPRLLEYYKEQVPFYLTNEAEEHLMYEIIYKHIHKWRDYIENKSFTKIDAPFEDLMELGEFASAIYSIRDISKDKPKEVTRKHFNNAWNEYVTVASLFVKEETPYVKEEDKAPHLEDIAVLRSYYTKDNKSWLHL